VPQFDADYRGPSRVEQFDACLLYLLRDYQGAPVKRPAKSKDLGG